MRDFVFVATHWDYALGDRMYPDFFWMDARMGIVLQEIGKYVKRNCPVDACVEIEAADSSKFAVLVSYEGTDGKWTVQHRFEVCRTLV